ncbi:hypothetical protein CIMIT_05560 [Corynebacterium imitans]|nr:hypothetical protein CIMIT_05560 [Corynebacterium imitans]
MGGWPEQRRASRCLEAIARIISEMEQAGDDVTSEKRYFGRWRDAVYAYPRGFEVSGSGISDEAFQTLGMFRNSARRFVPELSDGVVNELRELLENEPSLVVPPGVFPRELYDYFTRVKLHLKHCIDNYEVTSNFDLQEAAEHYRAAVFMMANGNFVTNPGDWGRHAAATFAATKAKNFGSAVYDEATNQLTQATVRALKAGGQKALEIGQSALDGLQ